MKKQTGITRTGLVVLLVCGLLVGALGAVAMIPQVRNSLFPDGQVRVVGQALVGGPFTLTDHTGKRVSDRDFRGKHMLIFFGFTNCPEICPTALQVATAALDKLGPKAERIVPIFITIDPERDNQQRMAEYVASFSPRLIGLTGTPEEIATVAKAYRVYARKVPDSTSAAGYSMDHSVITYVMGPDGAYKAHFTHSTDADAMASRLSKML